VIEIKSCEVCGSNKLRPVLNLGMHPLCDDLVEIGNSRICKEYPIDIQFCDICLTAHQRYQADKRELFPSSYHYRSRHTADVINGMQDLVVACIGTLGDLRGKRVLDVGCNDGSLLSFFAEAGAKTFGIEPTGAFEDARIAGHSVLNDYFCENVAKKFIAMHGKVDIVTFTNVFSHIEDLRDIIHALKTVCTPECLIIIENHYLGSILDNNQFDTFYHEHPRTYSLRSFSFIAESLDRKIIKATFPKRYGGNIRIFLRKNGVGTQESVAKRFEDDFGDRLTFMASNIAMWKARKTEQLNHLVVRYGPLSAKAFPGRAAILVKMLGLSTAHVACAHEKPTSAKIGHYIPSTRIPIVSDDAFDFSSRKPLLNFAWHICTEIEAYMRSRGFAREIINIVSLDDFRGQGE
jgi:SAM-dependent methyltransferase